MPHSVRRASATWASNASAGWQQVNISRSRSSGTSGSGSARSDGGQSMATSRSFAAPTAFRRNRSMARLRAAVVSQAPGRRGIPSRGQVCAASANASPAHSSARSQSPVTLIMVATSCPHSSRNDSASAAATSTAPPYRPVYPTTIGRDRQGQLVEVATVNAWECH
jgi:hypothetical protein